MPRVHCVALWCWRLNIILDHMLVVNYRNLIFTNCSIKQITQTFSMLLFCHLTLLSWWTDHIVRRVVCVCVCVCVCVRACVRACARAFRSLAELTWYRTCLAINGHQQSSGPIGGGSYGAQTVGRREPRLPPVHVTYIMGTCVKNARVPTCASRPGPSVYTISNWYKSPTVARLTHCFAIHTAAQLPFP